MTEQDFVAALEARGFSNVTVNTQMFSWGQRIGLSAKFQRAADCRHYAVATPAAQSLGASFVALLQHIEKSEAVTNG